KLSAAQMAALANDFSSARGSFILAAPSGPEGTPHRAGIWWLDPGAGSGPSLQLPALSAGWMYEGWVVGPDGPVSTGRFGAPSGTDSDAGGPAAGPGATPPSRVRTSCVRSPTSMASWRLLRSSRSQTT